MTVKPSATPAVTDGTLTTKKPVAGPGRNVTVAGPSVTELDPMLAIAVMTFVSALVEVSAVENKPVTSVAPTALDNEFALPLTDSVTMAAWTGWPSEFRTATVMRLLSVPFAVTGPEADSVEAVALTPTALMVTDPVAVLSTPFDSVALTTKLPSVVGAVTTTEQVREVAVQPVTVPSEPALVAHVYVMPPRGESETLVDVPTVIVNGALIAGAIAAAFTLTLAEPGVALESPAALVSVTAMARVPVVPA